MKRRLIPTFLAVAMSTAPAAAQTWTPSASDTGALIYGGVSAPQFSMRMTCTAPSQGGRALIETGDHETDRTDPYEMRINFNSLLADPTAGVDVLTIANVVVDGRRYGLPDMQWDDFYGEWGQHLSLAHPVFPALLAAQEMVVDPGLGTAYAYPVDGLSDGLRAGIAACVDGWRAAGNAVPAWVQPLLVADAVVPASYTPNAVPAFIADRIAQWCTGGGDVDLQTGLGEADFDGDGLPDYVFNGYGVSCAQGINPFCGASNCTVDVQLSSRGYEIVESWIGLEFGIDESVDGRLGYRRSANGSGPLMVWNGSAFMQASSDGAQGLPAIPEQITNYVAFVCGPDYDLPRPAAIDSGNLDGDSLPDFAIGWRDVVCPGRNVTEHCGASHCNIEAFLSTLNYTRNDASVGQSFGIAPLTNGLDGIGTTLSGFPVIQMWDGTSWVDALHLWDQSQ